MLRGERDYARLMALNASDPDGDAPGAGGPLGLYSLVWRLRGEQCLVRTSLDAAGPAAGGGAGGGGGGGGGGRQRSWAEALLPWRARGAGALTAAAAREAAAGVALDDAVDLRVGCTVSVQRDAPPEPPPPPPAPSPPPPGGGGAAARALSARRRGKGGGGAASGGGGDMWWRFECAPLTGGARRPPPPRPSRPRGRAAAGDADGPLAACAPYVTGPPLVVVLERVQSGLLGAALSSIGITGLYISFVFAIGRFLRLSFSNIRQRIPYEEFGSTRRVLAMVQVRRRRRRRRCRQGGSLWRLRMASHPPLRRLDDPPTHPPTHPPLPYPTPTPPHPTPPHSTPPHPTPPPNLPRTSTSHAPRGSCSWRRSCTPPSSRWGQSGSSPERSGTG
jgi:hypothetical protein